MAHVNDMEQHIRLHYLLQGGLEGRHQLVGQALDKANGVRQNSLLLVGQIQLPSGGVKGRKQFVLSQDPRAGQIIEKGGFPHVRPPNNRDKSCFFHTFSFIL